MNPATALGRHVGPGGGGHCYSPLQPLRACQVQQEVEKYRVHLTCSLHVIYSAHTEHTVHPPPPVCVHMFRYTHAKSCMCMLVYAHMSFPDTLTEVWTPAPTETHTDTLASPQDCRVKTQSTHSHTHGHLQRTRTDLESYNSWAQRQRDKDPYPISAHMQGTLRSIRPCGESHGEPCAPHTHSGKNTQEHKDTSWSLLFPTSSCTHPG